MGDTLQTELVIDIWTHITNIIGCKNGRHITNRTGCKQGLLYEKQREEI